MKTKTVQCSNCGESAAGQFCSHCGASLTIPGGRKQWNAQMLAPWFAVAVASIALIVSLITLFDSSRGKPEPSPMPFASLSNAPMSAPSGQPPDLSTMTPRQAADRLFNRIMTASEGGNKDEVKQFTPMALQAYENLGTLDNDARYHVALIHLASGDVKGAATDRGKLLQAAPQHLLGFMLEHQIAERMGDKTKAAKAYQSFLAAYPKEITVVRSEYQDHRSSIERFHKEAQVGSSGSKKTN